MTDEYKKKAQKSKSNLPQINSHDEAVAVFKKLQGSLLALRVEKVSAHHGHDHEHTEKKKPKDKAAKKKKKKASDKPKPPQNLEIQRDQTAFAETYYYAWFYETTQLQTIFGGIGIVVVVFGAILFPLWPPILRTAAWYLSIALLGLIAGIFIIAIVRLILFVITMFTVPPGIWLFPNLFEDVGFFESFVPLWAWEKEKKKKKKVAREGAKGSETLKSSAVSVDGGGKSLKTTVEDASDDE